MWKKALALTLCAAFIATGFTHAGEDKKKAVLKAAEVEKNVEKLLASVVWHQSVDAAREAAAREGKLILWIHMLGRLDGKT